MFEEEDYAQLWLSFCDEFPRYDSGLQLPETMSYKAVVQHIINRTSNQKVLKRFFEEDVKLKNKIDKKSIKLRKAIKSVIDGIDCEDNYAFITIGYNEQTITPSAMKEISKKVFDLPHWTDCQFVHEKHRENGIHHHTHFLVKFKSKIYKSKIIQYIFQIKNIKKYVLSKSFIDVKMDDAVSYENRIKYILGDKQQSKMKYVELDKAWRLENNL